MTDHPTLSKFDHLGTDNGPEQRKRQEDMMEIIASCPDDQKRFELVIGVVITYLLGFQDPDQAMNNVVWCLGSELPVAKADYAKFLANRRPN